MKEKLIIVALILLSLFTINAYAWNHSIELGYGYSHDPNQIKYNNSGILLTSDLLSLSRGRYTFWSITGALGQWHSTAPSHQNLTTGAVSLALRLYPAPHYYPAYLLGSLGPALLSSRKFGVNTQGSNLTLQTNIGLGMEFKSFDANLRLAHYSNAHIFSPNEGFNVLYLLSFGYLF
ncbi:MAG: acyloxyacyl hydrolase [Gammaproteobacteria bacterium]